MAWGGDPPGGHEAELDADNALAQVDFVHRLLEQPAGPVRIKPSLIRALNFVATESVIESAGAFRKGHVTIWNSRHVPPPAEQVRSEVEDMCAYLRDETHGAEHRAAYALWRLNWIHPFDDGNGRTARALSYLVLGLAYGGPPPGAVTVPELILQRKSTYLRTMEQADASWKRRRRVDVTNIENYLRSLFKKQLMSSEAAR